MSTYLSDDTQDAAQALIDAIQSMIDRRHDREGQAVAAIDAQDALLKLLTALQSKGA